jgi:hypothetical protein
MMISRYEAERWRQLSDELRGQRERLASLNPRTRAEWQAIDAIGGAERALFSAFANVEREYVPELPLDSHVH